MFVKFGMIDYKSCKTTIDQNFKNETIDSDITNEPYKELIGA